MLKFAAAFEVNKRQETRHVNGTDLDTRSATTIAGHMDHKQKGSAMNRDELEGKAEAVKGKVKQAAGDLTDNAALHDEGVADEAAGKTQETFGKAKRKVGEAIEDLGDAIKK
jgi:uncharacterized protein YjbJ (UPF0337 family)